MEEYLQDHGVTGKNVLFLHTGGLPLFFDILPELQAEKTEEL